MLVIGLGNKARQGKNWVARTMRMHAARRGYDAREYAFADALRTVCRVQFGMKEKDARLLQVVGTDVYRCMNPNIWVDTLKHRLLEEQPDVAFITDMRFINEADLIKSLGGYTIRVVRLNADGTPWLAKDRDPNHESETQLDTFFYDWTLKARDGELKQLERDALEMYDHLSGLPRAKDAL